ncbi:MAG: hypothetical protein N2205_00640 [Candidatus Caldatribacterium sp.]|nr:hypothetical protein [Candidatus Caldatribacterium sp.]MCX7729708.1 hypothetical protein [Candidatus Caldatribacterium sp.]MDW8081875.1 hypothetical protein [Candidatus Calescibacterium sp.]
MGNVIFLFGLGVAAGCVVVLSLFRRREEGCCGCRRACPFDHSSDA